MFSLDYRGGLERRSGDRGRLVFAQCSSPHQGLCNCACTWGDTGVRLQRDLPAWPSAEPPFLRPGMWSLWKWPSEVTEGWVRAIAFFDSYLIILSYNNSQAIENKSDSPTKWLDLSVVLLLVGWSDTCHTLLTNSAVLNSVDPACLCCGLAVFQEVKSFPCQCLCTRGGLAD